MERSQFWPRYLPPPPPAGAGAGGRVRRVRRGARPAGGDREELASPAHNSTILSATKQMKISNESHEKIIYYSVQCVTDTKVYFVECPDAKIQCRDKMSRLTRHKTGCGRERGLDSPGLLREPDSCVHPQHLPLQVGPGVVTAHLRFQRENVQRFD